MAATYRAMMITRAGGPEVLAPVDLPLTAPGPGELRVRVRACGVGATDLTMLSGKYAFAPKLPIVGGYEIAGVVEALGEGVNGFHVGQRVAALTVHGGFAEHLVREATHFVPVPDAVSDVEAAAVILNYVSAWQMIHRVAKLQSSESALVTGAGGGVGTALLQLLRLAGLRTYGAASTRKHELVAKLGATPIDYRGGPIDRLVRARETKGVDAAFDALGGANIARCIRAVKRGGAVVGYGFMAAESRLAKARMFFDVFASSRLAGRRGHFYGISLRYRKDNKPFLEDLPKIFALVARRQIEPVIAKVFPLHEARKALDLLATGTVAGKIVLNLRLNWLPQPRDQAMGHLVLVFGIARQIFDEEFFLVEQAPDQRGQDREKDEHSPPRSKRDRHAEQHDQRARIHRMPQQRVRATRDHLLVIGDFDGGGGKTVFAKHEKYRDPADRHQTIPGQRREGPHLRPAEAMIERGNHEQADESDRRDRHDDLLRGGLLRARPSPHPPRQELRIRYHEIDGNRQRRDKIKDEERPRLPVVKRARGDEHQRHRRRNQKQERNDRLLVLRHAAHRATFSTVLRRVRQSCG